MKNKTIVFVCSEEQENNLIAAIQHSDNDIPQPTYRSFQCKVLPIPPTPVHAVVHARVTEQVEFLYDPTSPKSKQQQAYDAFFAEFTTIDQTNTDRSVEFSGAEIASISQITEYLWRFIRNVDIDVTDSNNYIIAQEINLLADSITPDFKLEPTRSKKEAEFFDVCNINPRAFYESSYELQKALLKQKAHELLLMELFNILKP